MRYTGGGADDPETDGGGSLGGGGRGLLELGLGSRGGCLNGLEAGAGEDSLKSLSGVSRPEGSPAAPCWLSLREVPLMNAPRLVLRPCPRSSVFPCPDWADDVLRERPPLPLPEMSSTWPPMVLD